MKTRSPILLTLTILVLHAVGIPVVAQTTQPANPIVNGLQPTLATCVWKITYDMEMSPLSTEVLVNLLQSSDLHRAALKRLRERTSVPDGFLEALQVSFSPLPVGPRRVSQRDEEGLLMGRISIEILADVPVANEYAECLRATLEASLQKAREQDLMSLQSQRERLSREASELVERLRNLQERGQALAQKADRLDPSREGIVAASRQLETQQQGLRMELAALQARREALQNQILNTTAKVKGELAGSQVLTELEKAVQGLKERLAEQQQNIRAYENTSKVETYYAKAADVQSKLAEAVSHLAEARESASRASGGELLGKLNGELSSLAVGLAESQVRQKEVEAQLARLKEGMTYADEYEREIALELPLVKRAYQTVRERERELRERIDGFRPTKVTSLGNPEAAEPASQPAKTR